jgi:hypothetical protein
VKRPVLWLYVGVLLLVVISALTLLAIFGPVFIIASITAPRGSSALRNMPAGMRFYVAEVQKNTNLSIPSIYYRFAFNSGVSVALLIVAGFLARRRRWAWMGLFVVLAVSALNFLVLMAGAILSAPHAFTWGWLLEGIPFDSLLLYGAVVFIFLRPSVRALYTSGGQT